MTCGCHAKLAELEAQMVLTYAALQGSIAALAAHMAHYNAIDGQEFADGLRRMGQGLQPMAKGVLDDLARHLAALGVAEVRPDLRVVD